ncbi:transporter substrate-binding domain-containing protein [Cryptosporangium aurantiacum]|uniref:ABC-type amino acid transport substrate-binding protein n=1 Tax=Cryptosporangium aurantiacum TaxID=134849 RepID=A0A1M7RHY8_9ACTN|nr:transporter substrate-binding domain-containing protein [Cryptosporangium aurantiacum]SHN45874.1 ABC-type amino acid transport substrate-binding protein [Cryptosporangium aurantiacum]
MSAGAGPLARVGRVVCIVLLAVLTAVAACQSKTQDPDGPTVEEKLTEAGLRDENRPAKLRIGVYDWQPLLGYVADGRNEGFDIDVARYIAANLGYVGDDKIEWVPIDNVADRLKFLLQDKVDLVVASLSITEERKRSIAFAGPYLVIEQSVMVPEELKSEITTLQDLVDPRYKVCTSTASTSEKLLAERRVPFVARNSDKECFEGMQKGLYQAMSTDRSVLFGFQSEHEDQFQVLDLKLATASNPGVEEIGIGVSKKNPALRELVDYYLYKSYAADRRGEVTAWRQSFAEHLSVLGALDQPEPHDHPDLVDSDAKYPTR